MPAAWSAHAVPFTGSSTTTASVFICSFMTLGKDDVWMISVSPLQDLYMCMYLVPLILLIHLAAKAGGPQMIAK